MQFLRTLFWVVIAAFVAIIASEIGTTSRSICGAICRPTSSSQSCCILTFLIGFLPTWLIMRGKIWRLRRRLGPEEEVRSVPAAPAATAAGPAEDGL